jgi:hypothetical protein
MSQLTMFASGVPSETESARTETRRARAKAKKPKSTDQAFAEFHRDNPHVFDELKRLATERLLKGEKRIAIKALWEELRASLVMLKIDGDIPGYKLNNNFTALYARMLLKYPAFAAAIEVRKRKGER